MNKGYIIIAIGIIIVSSMFFTSQIFFQEIKEYCQENGFDYTENYDSSHACWKDEPTQLTVKKIRCEPDWLSIFTFRNPYRGCKFLKYVEVIE